MDYTQFLYPNIQLPDDVISKGYRKTGQYKYEQVFYSPFNNFTGTETQFIEAGLAYRYRQLDKYNRCLLA